MVPSCIPVVFPLQNAEIVRVVGDEPVEVRFPAALTLTAEERNPHRLADGGAEVGQKLPQLLRVGAKPGATLPLPLMAEKPDCRQRPVLLLPDLEQPPGSDGRTGRGAPESVFLLLFIVYFL